MIFKIMALCMTLSVSTGFALTGGNCYKDSALAKNECSRILAKMEEPGFHFILEDADWNYVQCSGPYMDANYDSGRPKEKQILLEKGYVSVCNFKKVRNEILNEENRNGNNKNSNDFPPEKKTIRGVAK
jgi:hypothetical protein